MGLDSVFLVTPMEVVLESTGYQVALVDQKELNVGCDLCFSHG